METAVDANAPGALRIRRRVAASEDGRASAFSLLIAVSTASTVSPKVIGNIPLSKAEPHRHLYEEALVFLNSAGMVWTEHTKARVGEGDVVFTPQATPFRAVRDPRRRAA